jgi:hypothetical protein
MAEASLELRRVRGQPRVGFLLSFERGQILWGVHVVVRLTFVDGDAERTGLLDRLSVDGPGRP